MQEPKNKVTEVSSGIINSFIRITKKTIIFGIIIPGVIYLIIRFLEIAFGYSWQDQLIFQYISYIYGIGYIVFLTYKAVAGQIHTTIYYSIGWILGLLLLFRFGVFNLQDFLNILLIPTIFVILKIIYLIFRKPTKIIRKESIRRRSP